MELGKAEVVRFKDGEVFVKIDETVRGRDVFVVQPTSAPVNENLMELLIFVDALKRASAKSINVDRKSTRLNSSHANISYAVFCLKTKNSDLYHTNQSDKYISCPAHTLTFKTTPYFIIILLLS